jgi:hypothetical protein
MSRVGLLDHLQSPAWPRPETVQVPIHDEGDDRFGLWMMIDGRLVEVALPHTRREIPPHPMTGRDDTEVSDLDRIDG